MTKISNRTGTAISATLLALMQAVPALAGNLLGVTLVDSYVKPKGAYVNIVAPGGPGAGAGLVPSDIIIGADGHKITGAAQLERFLSHHHAGDAVTLRVVHYSKPPIEIGVALGATASAPVRAAAVTGAAPPVPARAAVLTATVQWITYADPNEHAFTIQVPMGFNVTGGSRRMSAVEIRSGVEARSPDGAIDLFYGGVNVPIFTVPTNYLRMAGYRVGMYYSPGFGQQFLVMPYLDGENFAVRWGTGRVAKDCTGVSSVAARRRPDASRDIDMAYAAGGVRTSILAGEANFSCTMAGGPAIGYVFAATELTQTQVSALWDVKTLAGFVATAARAGRANHLLSHMVASFAIDPGWAAQQASVNAQTSRAVTQVNEAVSSAIIQNGRMLSRMSDQIVQSGQANADREFNAIEGYDHKAVRGTSDYWNPETGTVFSNLDNSKAHQYENNSRQTFGTDSENPPPSGLHELQQLPPDQ